jgi:HAD superfamily hydrolase (TIGR01490 family)
MATAFFDLDRTILAVNSATLWLKRELRLGHISRTWALKGASWVALYQMGFANMDDVLAKAMSTVAGMDEALIDARTIAFYDEEVRHQVRRGAREAIAAHQKKGDTLVLLTSSSAYLSRPFVRDLALDDYLCSEFEVDGGLFTGRPRGALCFGAGKVTHARAYIKEKGGSLNDATFYTDSYSDLPMLEAVGAPVVVHPDMRLRRTALSRGWPIVDWGSP